MKTIKKVLKGMDIYGKPMILKFNKKGDTFKTVLGGISSIITFMCIIAYSIYRFYVLHNKLEVNINSI